MALCMDDVLKNDKGNNAMDDIVNDNDSHLYVKPNLEFAPESIGKVSPFMLLNAG